MKKFLNSNQFKHGTMATVFTIVFIAVIIGINIVMAVLTERYPSMNIDLTAQKLNSLSDESKETIEGVELKTEIFLIGTEEQYMNNALYSSSGVQYSQVALLALKMEEANKNISTEYLDPDLQPQFIAQYADDNLKAGDILVRTENRYLILQVNDLFSISKNEQTGAYKHFTSADGALTNAIHIVNLETVPVIAIATGHEEMLTAENLATFETLVEDNGFLIKNFNILTEEIPEEADVIFLPTPTTDYSADEITKLEEFLAPMQSSKMILVTSYPTQGSMPNFETFLVDWGIAVKEGIVIEGDTTKTLSGTEMYFFGTPSWEYLKENTYENLLCGATSALELTFKSSNEIVTYPLIQTSDKAYISIDGTEEEAKVTGTETVAAIAQKLTTVDNAAVYSSVVVYGGSVQFVSDFLGNSTYSNKNYIVDLLQHLTGTSDASSGLYVSSTETNVADIVATNAIITLIGLYGFTIVVPLIILIAGLVVFLRRRHL